VTAARDDGALVAAIEQYNVLGGFRTAKLDGAARKRVETLAKALWTKEDQATAIRSRTSSSPHCCGLPASRPSASAAAETPVPEGSYEANPATSVPKLVAKVAKAEGLSAAAAALYLQTLALAEPTQASVCRWNAWTPKQYKAAAAELVKKKLVVEGKRERAGRTIFVKGGYTKGDGKDLPMEEWKLPFYDVLDRHVPGEPAHLLFARAWKRIEDGDRPR